MQCFRSSLPNRQRFIQHFARMMPLVLMLMLLLNGGCRLISRRYAGPNQDGTPVAMPNPMTIAVSDVDFAWLQIVDMVDDYFDIIREQPVREIEGVLMEGQIQTKPRTGATCMEFLRRDSTPGYERWHSTLQSIQRTGFVRVIPAAGGFQVYLEVQKELEDVSQPEFSTIGRRVRRHDGSLVSFQRSDEELGPATLGWIAVGRDQSLEQEMLRQLHARLFNVAELPSQ